MLRKIRGTKLFHFKSLDRTIDLLLIDQQSVVKRSPSDGHCQSKKEMDDHLLVCQQF
jgi:hypothetical protein